MYTYIDIRMCLYAHVSIDIRMYMYVYMYEYICVYMWIYERVCTRTCTLARTYVWVVNAMLRVTPSAPFKSPAAHSI